MIHDILDILSMFVLVALIIAVALLAGLYAERIITALVDALRALGML